MNINKICKTAFVGVLAFSLFGCANNSEKPSNSEEKKESEVQAEVEEVKTISDLFTEDELLETGISTFNNFFSMSYGLVCGAYFEQDPSTLTTINGKNYELFLDKSVRTVEGFNDFYYSHYSKKYPKMTMTYLEYEGMMYGREVNGIGSPAGVSYEITAIREIRDDEVVYNVDLISAYDGSRTPKYFTLVYEDGNWKYGTTDLLDQEQEIALLNI